MQKNAFLVKNGFFVFFGFVGFGPKKSRPILWRFLDFFAKNCQKIPKMPKMPFVMVLSSSWYPYTTISPKIRHFGVPKMTIFGPFFDPFLETQVGPFWADVVLRHFSSFWAGFENTRKKGVSEMTPKMSKNRVFN